MNDTTEEAARVQREIIMSKTPEERILMGAEMIDSVRLIVEASIRNKQPDISEIDLKIAVFRRYYTPDFSPEQLDLIEAHLRQWHARQGAK
jgi:hypothetical protein